jgi:hypothetical protein
MFRQQVCDTSISTAIPAQKVISQSPDLRQVSAISRWVSVQPSRQLGTRRFRCKSSTAAAASAESQHLDDGELSWHLTSPTRRLQLLATGSLIATLTLTSPLPACAVRNGVLAGVDDIPPFNLSDFVPEDGWHELDSGLIFKVVKEGEGDKTKGIFDKVDHFQPFPFVTVRYAAYEPSGKAVASSISARRDYSYQAGVRQEIQDEDGAVMSMVVGERRQFVAPLDVAYKRKLFGQPVPQRDAILVDVELLYLQPY